MAAPRVLARPPIVEALVDFRARVSRPQEEFEAFARELSDRFPTSKAIRGIRAELRVDKGRLIPPTAEDLGFQGITLSTKDGVFLLQFSPEGFTLNNLNSYVGGDRLISEALDLWTRFAERMGASTVTRVALRYINRLNLPLREGGLFEKYLTATPELPEGAPQKVSEFLQRIVAHDEGGSTAIVTQKLDQRPGVDPAVLVDVDVFQAGEFATTTGELRNILEALRMLKNQTFFSLLTEEAVSLYEH